MRDYCWTATTVDMLMLVANKLLHTLSQYIERPGDGLLS